MEKFLIAFAFVLLVIVAILFLNEKLVKKTNEIALLFFSLIIGIVLAIFYHSGSSPFMNEVMDTIDDFRIDKLLLDVLLCFMMFTGASELKLPSLVNNFKPICLLALLTTVLTAAIYGLLFWGLTSLLGMNIGFVLCFLLGAIVSPTDPIAATGILNKMGLPKNVTAVMEGESLFNDGTGIALFIFVKSLYVGDGSVHFFLMMGKELFGAIAVGLLVSFLFSFLIKSTKDPIKHIMVSMVSVSLCYAVCEVAGFSGGIACAVCGIYFSTMMDRLKLKEKTLDPKDYYKDFWMIVDTILNYILYVMIGISFIYVNGTKWVVILILAAIIFNLVARYIGVYLSTLISRQCPDGYKTKPFSMLMTWGGLKGGLCLALAMSAADFLPQEAYNFILLVTFTTIIFTTVCQGLSVGKTYQMIKKRWPANPVQEQDAANE